MEPITLNEAGEQLITIDDMSEESTLTSFNVGRHLVCGGTMRIFEVSKTHNTLVCPECFFRILLPKGVKTYRDLRAYMFELSVSWTI